MADNEGVPETAEGEKRRRGPPRNRPRKPKAESAAGASAGDRPKRERKERAEPQEKKERPKREPREPREPRERVPVPAELVGQTLVGSIVDVFIRGGSSFGFIGIDNDVRVHFRIANFVDREEFKARRGYEVEFTADKDEKDRVFASNVKLTHAGRQQAIDKEAKLVAEKAAAPAVVAAKKPRAPKAEKAVDAEERKPREKRERKPRAVRPEDERSVPLLVSCQGSSETKVVVAPLSQSIGKFKHAATEAFGAPTTYNVFHNDSLLTKAVLRTLADNSPVHIKEPVAATA